MRPHHEPSCSGEKRCSKCEQVKPAIAFPVDHQALDGLAYHCRECMRESAAKHRRERLRQAPREIRRADFCNPAGKYGIN